MTSTGSSPTTDRIIGRVEGVKPGPVVVIIAGVHGNEPAGPIAVRRIVDTLSTGSPPLAGIVVALAGNLRALASGVRFVDTDLGRLWTDEEVDRARGDLHPALSEQAELRELLREIDALEARYPGQPITFLELHSTSGHGAPFQAINDTLHDRAIAFASRLPLLLGLEEAVRGSLLEYMAGEGRSVLVIEGGQHLDTATADRLEAAVWLALGAVGSIPAGSLPLRNAPSRLRAESNGAPPVTELVYRHPIEPQDRFVMRPGFRHFEPVRKGDLLADDRNGPVLAPVAGLLVMPLYQGQGSDGFFIARPVHRAWLTLSSLLRTLKVDRLLEYLPGVRHDPVRPRMIVVDTRVARFLLVPIFHLCGYRRVSSAEGQMTFTRRIEAPR